MDISIYAPLSRSYRYHSFPIARSSSERVCGDKRKKQEEWEKAQVKCLFFATLSCFTTRPEIGITDSLRDAGCAIELMAGQTKKS